MMEHLILQEPWNRCDECGKFIPFDDFDRGFAMRNMVTPSSDRSEEKWETYCAIHNPCIKHKGR